MSNPFVGEPDPFEITVTARLIERRESWILEATVENGTGADGGEVGLHVTDSARRSYGLESCVDEFERFLNSRLGPEFRLAAALAMAEHGPFMVVTGDETAPSVIAPEMPGARGLAA